MWVVMPDLRRITWIYDVSESMPPDWDPSKYHITIFGLGNIGRRRKLVLVHNPWFQARKLFIMGLTCVTRGRGGRSGGCDVTPPPRKTRKCAVGSMIRLKSVWEIWQSKRERCFMEVGANGRMSNQICFKTRLECNIGNTIAFHTGNCNTGVDELGTKGASPHDSAFK